MEIKFTIPSPEASSAKVPPRKISPTTSSLYPDPQTESELELKKPKSGIFINESQKKEASRDYDSFDLVYKKSARPESWDSLRGPHRKPKSKKKSKLYLEGDGELEKIQEKGEYGDGKKSKKKKKRRKSKPSEEQDEEIIDMDLINYLEQRPEEDDIENYLTKQFRRKVSQASKTTSYQSKDYKSVTSSTEVPLAEHPTLNKYVQKFRRESETKRYEPVRKKIKRGTLESHSFTKMHQPFLKEFYFGSKEGTMHQGDDHFESSCRNAQGICMPVAAYCFSLLKHPNKWTPNNVDQILEYGNNLYLKSTQDLHMHQPGTELKPENLEKYCYIEEKKIRFTVDEPEISGMLFSDDKKVYNLTKGLQIFFARKKAAILQSQGVNVCIWRDKYFYFFDAKPRTKDLYVDPKGTAIMANFYDIPAVVTVLLQRSDYGNWPFILFPIRASKILPKDEEESESEKEMDARSNYNILSEIKAVVNGSFDLGDKCFEFTRNKQALTMSVVALVYSRITPPSAWHRTTLNKILIIGNQLFIECAKENDLSEVCLENLPAIFTLGPYLVEIYIYANRFCDVMFKKCQCQFKTCLEQFFETSSNAVVQIGKFVIAVWKQRNMFFCFDPYSRNNEALNCRDGAACVSMHATLESLVETITSNFDCKDYIFYIHALKVCKIHRDPVQSGNFPLTMTMNDYPVEEIKKHKVRRSSKKATEKPVTVDYTALAMVKLLAGESPKPSIFEVGSKVDSLLNEQLPPMICKKVSKSFLKNLDVPQVNMDGVVADLDSPSLSDTQIEPPLPEQPKDDTVDFMDLDSFQLTQEEIELQDAGEDLEGGGDMRMTDYEGMLEQELKAAALEAEGAEDDWYMATIGMTQVGGSLEICPEKVSEMINTDITYLPMPKEILYPTYLRGKQRMRKRLHYPKSGDGDWDPYCPPEPEVTQSEELRKETNFVDLPDDTQLIRGTKNVSEFGDDLEFIAPFICIMASTVSKKYSMLSWAPEIVDYVLKCGAELYKASKVRYDQVTKLEIPRISLGKMDYAVLVEYIFDTYWKQNILELAIDKILFAKSDMGILVTPTYACAVFFKNHLYYMYDAFGNNEVGLSEGPSNSGVACFARFKDVHSLVTRIVYNRKKRDIYEDVKYTRFVLSTVRVKQIPREKKDDDETTDQKSEAEDGDKDYQGEDDEVPQRKKKRESKKRKRKGDEEEGEEEEKKEPELKVGYQRHDNVYVLQGSKVLGGKGEVSEELKEDHFVCLCACLMIMSCPVKKWDNKRVDQVLDHGNHVYNHAEDLDISEKRIIKNVLIDKHFFDIIVKRIKIQNWKDNKNLYVGIDTILRKKMAYFLVQYPNACYVVHKSSDDIFHLFDPYGVPKGDKKAGWIRCKNLNHLKHKLKMRMKKGAESYMFFTFEVTSIKKAPKEVLLAQKLQEYEMKKAPKDEYIGKPFYEDSEWLKADPIPWSRKKSKTASGNPRRKPDYMWCNWDVEYSNDLFSLAGNIHQTSERFSEESRGKQTLCTLVVAIAMLDIYELEEWNAAVVDSVLVNGDNYFQECVKDIEDEDYELSFDDLKEESSIFPFSFKINFEPVVEGTMFLVRLNQFNMYKALRYFFNNFKTRCGIICSTKQEKRQHVAFGKLQSSEYFMFDCQSYGPPMFNDREGCAYILKTTTLNRLLHVLTLTLRGGDFYIYEVETYDLSPIS